jgi:hypothetical protein
MTLARTNCLPLALLSACLFVAACGGDSHESAEKESSGASTGGGAPHVVKPCPSIGSSKGWEDITPPGVLTSDNDATLSFVIDPKDASIVYLGTVKKGLFKTTDCGATWTHVNTGTHGAELDTGMMGTMAMDPNDPSILYTDNRYGPGGLFKSSNGGVDWEQVFQPTDILNTFIYGGTVEWVAMDPADSTHLVVSPHFSCANPHSEHCMIELSNGKARVIENTPPMDEIGGQVMLDAKTWLVMTQATGIWRTADQGATWTNVYKGAALPSLYQGPDGAYYVPNNAGLLRSANGIDWEMVPGNTPVGALAGAGNKIFVSAPYVAVNYASYTIGGSGGFTPLPAMPSQEGGWMIRYDADHELLYSSNFRGGFWRLSVPK